MARSNWATLAWNANGEVSDRLIVGDTWVEPYKNWIYLHDPKAWRGKESYIKDTVMEIQHGSFQYRGIKINAKRVRLQNAMLFFVEHGWHFYLEEKNMKHIYQCLFGVCCYGYNDDGDWIGVTPELIEELKQWVHEIHPDDIEYPVIHNASNPSQEDVDAWSKACREIDNQFPPDLWENISAPKDFLLNLIKPEGSFNQGSVYMYRAMTEGINKKQDTPTNIELLQEVAKEKESLLERILDTPEGKEAATEAFKPVIDEIVKLAEEKKEE